MINPKWANDKKTMICTDDGMSIPAVEGNMDYYHLVANEISIGDYVAPSVSYEDARSFSYGRLSDQLDMQYHDSVNGTTTWLDHVKSVKDANPKE